MALIKPQAHRYRLCKRWFLLWYHYTSIYFWLFRQCMLFLKAKLIISFSLFKFSWYVYKTMNKKCFHCYLWNNNNGVKEITVFLTRRIFYVAGTMITLCSLWSYPGRVDQKSPGLVFKFLNIVNVRIKISILILIFFFPFPCPSRKWIFFFFFVLYPFKTWIIMAMFPFVCRS